MVSADCSALAPCDQTGSFQTAGQVGRERGRCGAVSVNSCALGVALGGGGASAPQLGGLPVHSHGR